MGVFLQTHHHPSPTLASSEDGVTATFGHEGSSFRRDVRACDEAIEVEDSEQGASAFRVFWQLAPGCEVVEIGESFGLSWRITKGRRQWIMQFCGAGVSVTKSASGVSAAYGQVETAPALLVTANGSLRTRLERRR
jgi:hypothetical protein